MLAMLKATTDDRVVLVSNYTQVRRVASACVEGGDDVAGAGMKGPQG